MAGFVATEDSARLALEIAHRELERLNELYGLSEDDVKSLKTLHEILDRHKDMELKEHKIRGSCPRCHGQGR